ncbi:MAG: peptide-modifying radical SAM enzyme CbpB [Candidatus Omnitrophota bacterium]
MKNSDKDSIVLDADNVFWAATKANKDPDYFVSREALSLYEKVKDSLDIEFKDFRFSQELTAIYINPTNRCNANCPYCYIPPKIRENGRSMTEDELTFILEKISKYFKNRKRKPVIVFHASEPLLVKDILFESIKKFKDRFYFGLQTNAILLEKTDVEFLKNHKVGVGISLDSFDPKINNSLRSTAQGKRNFNKAAEAIDWFGGYEGLNVITTITKRNVSHLPGIVEFLHMKKVSCVLLNPVRITRRSTRILKPDEQLLIKHFIKAVDKAITLTRSSGRRIIIGNFSNVILGIIAPTARRLMCDISPCGGGRCFLTVTAAGDMIPCGEFIGLKGFSGGNIFKTDIERAMQSLPFKKIRGRIVEKITECRICNFRNICGAPCPAELHSLGSMYKKSVFCGFYKEIIKYAFKLIAEGKEKYLLRQGSFEDLQYEYKL